MPIYEATLFKTTGGVSWVNAYRFSAPSLDVAVGQQQLFVNAERIIHYSSVMIDAIRISLDPDPLRTQFVFLPVGQAATTPRTTSNLAPMGIVVFVLLGGATGRPGKKFYRFALEEADFAASGMWPNIDNPTRSTSIRDALTSLRTNLEAAGCNLVIGKHNRNVTSVSVKRGGYLDIRKGWYNKKTMPA